MEILEHLHINPLFALREINRVLKPKGTLILSTPNINLLHKIMFLFGKSYQENPLEAFKTQEKFGFMGHIRLYFEHEIKQLLEATAFKPINAHTKICQFWKVKHKGNYTTSKTAKLATALKHPRKYFTSSIYITATKIPKNKSG
jgi:SAM-dependent methyltransferase